MSVAAPPRWEVLYAEAHAERFRYLAGAGAEFLRRPGLLAVRTGASSNVDNGIVLEREDADIDGLVDWFHEPASLICSGFDASDELRARLAGAGLDEERSGVTSGAALGELPELVSPAGITISAATDARDLDDWLAVARQTAIYEEHDRRPLPVRHWVARRADRPVGLATAFFTSTTVLLEHVAVVEDERRRGIATALALVRLREGRRFGCELAVFGTTPESAALYERFGFTTQPDEGRRWFYLP
jgi:GNAT superfamily N-acetyltransferase